MKNTLSVVALSALALLVSPSSHAAPKADTLDDLKKLEITCLVPAWLPEGYGVKKVHIDFSDRDGLKDPKARGFAAYDLEYGNGKKGRFTVESARWGIGDRNLDQDDRAEESHFNTKRFGPIYIIYFPPGKTGVKDRISANWIEDENIRAERAKGQTSQGIKGRFHGVSGYGMTVADFEKIVRSLHPAREK